MPDRYNWSNFYDNLCQYGSKLLLGIDEELREIIQEASSSTDMFWSEELQVTLAEVTANGTIREGVLAVLELWRENVIETLDADFGIELDRQSVSLDLDNPLIDSLVAAASTK